MDSTKIKTVGCPLDHDSLKSLEQSSLESSCDSDHSEATDEESIMKQNKLIKSFKNLFINDVSDYKHLSSKCSDKIMKINSQNKIYSKNLNFTKDEAKNSHVNNEALNLVESSIYSSNSNNDCDDNLQKRNDTKKLTFVDSTKNDEKQFLSLSPKNNKLLNNSCKSVPDTSAEYESDSDDNEDSQSVILKERYPQRHNRPENNRHYRTIPFPQNHTKTYEQYLNSESSQTSVNIYPAIYDFNILHDACDSLNNIHSTNFEKNNAPSVRTFDSCYSSLESMTDVAFESINSYTMSDQIYNDVIPCKVTNQIVSGVIPYTMVDEVFDSVVPSYDTGNVSDAFSAEINDISYFDNFKKDLFSESNNTGCIIPNVELNALLDSDFEDLPAEEVEQFLKELTESKSDGLSSQNHGNLSEGSLSNEFPSKEVENVLNNSFQFNQNNNVASTCKETSYRKSNQYNFDTEENYVHSVCLKENVENILLCPYLAERNNNFENSSEFYNICYNKHANNSNSVSKNITSVNETSDFINVSEEIEHKIEEWVMKEQNNASKLTCPENELNWSMFPFFEIDDNSSSELSNNECVNTSEYKLPGKKNDSKHKNLNKTYKKAEQPKIFWMLGTAARDRLFKSQSFCNKKFMDENKEIRQQIEKGILGTEKKKIIHYLNKNRKTKYRGTNLHRAIISRNIEKVCCIVECHKECHETIPEINLRDSSNKTVLDYSKQMGMDLLTDYLIENNAKESVSV